MSKLLITGAAGFLGSHLVDLMLSRGHEVMGIDDLSHGNVHNLERALRNSQFEFRQVDVRDMGAMRNSVGRIDTVVHLAAYKIPRYGTATKTLLVNSEGTLNALQLACEKGANFVITSTSDVYGKNTSVPFAEDSDSVLGPPTVGRWAYATSKRYDEHLVLAMAEDFGISATILRIFGSYGPRQNLSWWGGPQSVFIDAILRDEIIPIHGDGLQTRSFTFVSDTIRGIAAAAESTNCNQEIINIGSSEEVSILDLASRIYRLCGKVGAPAIKMIPYDEIANRKYEDVRRRIPDTRKAKELLNFEAKITLEQGLGRTIEWQRQWVTPLVQVA